MDSKGKTMGHEKGSETGNDRQVEDTSAVEKPAENSSEKTDGKKKNPYVPGYCFGD